MGNPFTKLFGKDKGKQKTDPAPAIGGGPGVADLIPAAPAGPAPAPAPAFIPAAPRAAERAGTDTGTPRLGTLQIGRDRSNITEKRLITLGKVMERPAFKAKPDHPLVREIFDSIAAYQGIIAGNEIPAADSPDFIKRIGQINAVILGSHDALTAKFAEASESFRTMSKTADKKDREPFSLLADNCANLATLALSQKTLLNKVYDDLMTALRSNPETVSNFSGKDYQELLLSSSLYQLPSSAQALGSGAINTVYRAGTPDAPKVFKEGTVHQRQKMVDGFDRNTALDVMTRRMGYSSGQIEEYGTKPQHQGIAFANTAQRDVAVSRIDKLLGLDMAVNTQLASSQGGNTSSLMDMAQGSIAGEVGYYSGEDNREAAGYWYRNKLEAEIRSKTQEIEAIRLVLSQTEERINRLSAIDISTLDESALRTNQERLANANREKASMISKLPEREKELTKLQARLNEPTLVNLQSPEVVGQLFRMTLLDLIVGHVDRHSGNYMMAAGEEGVKIRAIDNDTSFSLNTDIMEGTTKTGGIYPKLKSAFPFVPPEIRDKVQTISEENIRQTLTGLLGPLEINAACERFRIVKEYIGDLESKGQVTDYNPEDTNQRASLFQGDDFTNYLSHLFKGFSMEGDLSPAAIASLLSEERAKKEASAQPTVADETESSTTGLTPKPLPQIPQAHAMPTFGPRPQRPLPMPGTQTDQPAGPPPGAVPTFQNVRYSGPPQRPLPTPFFQRRNKPLPTPPGAN